MTDFQASRHAAPIDGVDQLVELLHRGGKPLSLVAEETGIEPQHLSQFMRAEGELNAAEIGRVLEAVGVEFVETAPTR